MWRAIACPAPRMSRSIRSLPSATSLGEESWPKRPCSARSMTPTAMVSRKPANGTKKTTIPAPPSQMAFPTPTSNPRMSRIFRTSCWQRSPALSGKARRARQSPYWPPQATGEGALYQAYFYPSTLEAATNKDVTWTGYTQSLWVDMFGNLREDTIADGIQDYKVDLIVKTRLDTGTGNVLVDKFRDVGGDGLADDTNGDGVITHADCYICDKALADIKPIWEAGKQLALKDASSRTILTWVDSDHDGVVDSSERIAFSTANSSTLSPYLRAAVAPSVYTADAIINFIRGCDPAVCTEQANLRDRRLQCRRARRLTPPT